MEERGAIALYLVFTALAVGGVYWSLASVRGRAAGAWGAVAAVLFFILLGWGLRLLLHQAGVP